MQCYLISSPARVAPSRGRGLKHFLIRNLDIALCRPFTGAWIETVPVGMGFRFLEVAPSRGRGLKHVGRIQYLNRIMSPLHGGVD